MLVRRKLILFNLFPHTPGNTHKVRLVNIKQEGKRWAIKSHSKKVTAKAVSVDRFR